MKLHYYPETDSLYIELRGRPSVETREVSAGLNVDFGADGSVVGFDIDRASAMDLDTLEAPGLPTQVRRPIPGGLVRKGRLLVGRSTGRTITLEETNAALEEERNERGL